VAAAVLAMALLGEFRVAGFFVGHELAQQDDDGYLAADEPELLLAATWSELRDGGSTEVRIEPAADDLTSGDEQTAVGDWPAVETIAMTETAMAENMDELPTVAPAWLILAVEAGQLPDDGATETQEE
jgi:hypothetical protein